REAHHLLASHDPSVMDRAVVSYAALVAADTPAFAKTIEKMTAKKKKRKAFLQNLSDDPAMIRNIDGADAAIESIMNMAARDATRISLLGGRFITDAYTIQNQGWAKRKLQTNGTSRVNGATKWAASRSWPEMAASPAIRSKAGTLRPNLVADAIWTQEWSADMSPPKPNSKAGAFMTKALILGARYATNDLKPEHLDRYASSRATNRCFVSAKLNFDQCIAATRTPFEEAFCIGTHGLNDISRCVGWPAGAGTPK
ncbi:MAG: hypothetical protein AAF723_09585, partial [Pseudomonadota bacterium]